LVLEPVLDCAISSTAVYLVSVTGKLSAKEPKTGMFLWEAGQRIQGKANG
jgi:hypothetical protein